MYSSFAYATFKLTVRVSLNLYICKVNATAVWTRRNKFNISKGGSGIFSRSRFFLGGRGVLNCDTSWMTIFGAGSLTRIFLSKLDIAKIDDGKMIFCSRYRVINIINNSVSKFFLVNFQGAITVKNMFYSPKNVKWLLPAWAVCTASMGRHVTSGLWFTIQTPWFLNQIWGLTQQPWVDLQCCCESLTVESGSENWAWGGTFRMVLKQYKSDSESGPVEVEQRNSNSSSNKSHWKRTVTVVDTHMACLWKLPEFWKFLSHKQQPIQAHNCPHLSMSPSAICIKWWHSWLSKWRCTGLVTWLLIENNNNNNNLIY